MEPSSHSTPSEKRKWGVIVTLIMIILLMVAVVVVLYSAPSFPVVAASVTPSVSSSSESYLIVLNQEQTKDLAGVSQMEEFLNLAPDCRYQNSIKGFACRMTESQRNRVQVHPSIAFIERDIIVQTMQYGKAAIFDSLPIENGVYGRRNIKSTATVGQFIPWGVERIGSCTNALNLCDHLQSSVPDVDVFVVDTGIDYQHPDLNVISHRTFVTTAQEKNRGGMDMNGHGTHVAGIIGAKDNATGIVGVCPGARLHAVKVLDSSGSGYMSWILAGLDYIGTIKAKSPTKRMVVNLSLGATSASTTSMDLAIQRLIQRGITCVVAAGNDATSGSSCSPAHVSEAITVGSYDSSNTWSHFSNYGSCVDLVAPGSSIVSTYPKRRYATLSGTSMACPHATGAVALYLATTPANPSTVRNHLLTRATCPSGIAISNVPAYTSNVSVYVGI
jgi:subtilisin family serine protease